MNLKNITYKISLFFWLIIIILFGIFLTKNSNISINSVKESGRLCVDTLIPSLFPFIFFSSFMINSGIFYLIGKFLNIFSYIFFLPKEAISVIILSMVGGFPVGAKGVKDLFDKKVINNEQAERMLMFCVNSGPSFILGVIGTSLIKNINQSIIILTSQILSSIFVGIFLGVYSRNKYKDTYVSKNKSYKIFIGDALVSSCESSCIAMLNMCALVIIFGVFFSFMEKLNILHFLEYLIIKLNLGESLSKCFPLIVLEVTNACVSISKYKNNLVLFSFATSWAGLCVHSQIFSIIRGIKIKYSKFLLFRVINSCFSSFITFLILKFRHIQINNNIEVSKSSHIWGSLSLVAFCIYFLIDLNFYKNKK